MKKISVIIVTYNSENHIYDCLESLFNYNDIGNELEVIVVDNNSKNGSELKKKLKILYDNRIIFIENEKNGGYGQGNNLGIRVSVSPIIMIMNPDVRLIMPLFKSALRVFEKKNVVEYGVQQLNKDLKKLCSVGVSSIIHPLIAMPLLYLSNKIGFFFPKWMFLQGACFFIRKSVFEEVGLFDERLFMYREEDDIHYRLMKKDKKNTIVFNNKLSYLHLHGNYMTERSINNCEHERASLNNCILINKERGINSNIILRRNILSTQMLILKYKIMSWFKHDEQTLHYYLHLKQWLLCINEIKKATI